MFGKLFKGKKTEQAVEPVMLTDIIPPTPTIDEEQMHREELARRIQALDDEERRIVIDNLPIELCFNRIWREFEENKAFKESIKSVIQNSSERETTQREKDLQS